MPKRLTHPWARLRSRFDETPVGAEHLKGVWAEGEEVKHEGLTGLMWEAGKQRFQQNKESGAHPANADSGLSRKGFNGTIKEVERNIKTVRISSKSLNVIS